MAPRLRTPINRRTFLALPFLFACIAWVDDALKRTPVESSNLASIGYDERRRVLEIEFRSGGIYRYLDVPKEISAALMAAESKGRCFIASVRGKFRFERVKASSIAGKQ